MNHLRSTWRHLAAAALAAALILPAWAAAPNQITYQGRLMENNALVNATRDIMIDLCSDSGGTTCYNAFSNAATPVTNGIFKAVLTVPASANLETGAWWLKIKVNGSALSPLEPLSSHPYAVVASSVAASGVRPGHLVARSTSAVASDVALSVQNQGGADLVRVRQDGNVGITGAGLSAGAVAFSVVGGTFVARTDGRIGIGTTDPQSRLEIKTNGGNDAILLSDNDYIDWGTPGIGPGITGIPGSALNAGLWFSGANSQTETHMLIQRGGNVGIGDPLPGVRLRVSSGAVATETVFQVTTGGTDRLTVKGDGKVGIGITNPSAPLHVWGTTGGALARVEGTATSGVSVELQAVNTGGRLYSLRSSANGASEGGGKFSIKDETAGLIRLMVDSTGNVGIGGTGPSTSRLWAQGDDAADFHLRVSSQNASGTLLVVDKRGGVGVGTAVVTSTLQVAGPIGLGNGTAGGNEAIVISLTNQSGGALPAGTIVIAHSTQDNSFTTAGSLVKTVIGVVYDASIANGSVGRVAIAGVVGVRCLTVTRGNHVVTSGTAGFAGDSSAPGSGESIGIWLEGDGSSCAGGTRRALLR